MDKLSKILTTWGTVTKVITGTAATVVILVASASWFQGSGAAEVQHTALEDDFHAEMSQHISEQTINSLEADLERIELAIKMYAALRERRDLTPDEQDELEYLKARRLQIRERLYDK